MGIHAKMDLVSYEPRFSSVYDLKYIWLKVEPKQSTLFFKTFISFSIVEDKVEHAKDVLDEEATLAWQISY